MSINESIHNLGEDMGTTYKPSSDSLVLYDTRAYSPKKIAVLSSDQMYELVAYWLDGLCPVCAIEIPEGYIICDTCFEQAVAIHL